MITALTIWNTLDNVKHSIFNEHMEGMMHVSIAIAGILAGLTILKNYNGFVKGDGLDAFLILKPGLLLILIANFHTLVMTPLDSLVTPEQLAARYEGFAPQYVLDVPIVSRCVVM